ncbi:hypothetical protein SAMN06265365_10190 [Tistlia consotensis]|uniref:Uncharacterized protein n=1 Tax=Tistlia consotensis USBA 355 TaxID=560819 RepID=A0A1Y6B3P7_9PROT|nr:hypothetical protein [Tistlia consotensis]SME88389.1 hypothetical protein SAMN05428998_10190 [Tistlia consotensis USBA 355]SNR24845.1 hypothetical protein SAMN06265365_10190 [Tistlia consotensis]
MTVEKNTQEARQGERSRTAWRTLIWSTTLSTIGVGVVLIWYFVIH